MSDANAPVLVTGGTGFLAAHIILRLLKGGHTVRTTVRTLDREPEVRVTLAGAGADTGRLSFVAADLTRDDGWSAAAAGCEYVLHVASPFPPRQPKNAGELIVPARQGALRVLRAAEAAGVRRVVMTSSFAAIGYSPKPGGAPYDENDWTQPTEDQSAYVQSKTLAERAAWDFVADPSVRLELVVINPVGIFGPALGSEVASSVGLIQMLIRGRPPLLPRASFAVVDVRDAADVHLRAMRQPLAAGQRFLASAGQPLTLPQIASILRERLGVRGAQIPAREAPDWIVRAAARFVPALGAMADLLGPPKLVSVAKATEVLGWQPRPATDTIAETGESLLGLATAHE
jgi:nucleoside-diphosphate-sugar epimerase